MTTLFIAYWLLYFYGAFTITFYSIEARELFFLGEEAEFMLRNPQVRIDILSNKK